MPDNHTDQPNVFAAPLKRRRLPAHGAARGPGDLAAIVDANPTLDASASLLADRRVPRFGNDALPISNAALQAWNRKLTALNGQLRDRLAHQHRLANELASVLNSTDIAMLRLDADLNIRFFTSAATTLFGLMPGDTSRKLADFHASARQVSMDETLADDATAVLHDLAPHEREVEMPGDTWFIRYIRPYRIHDRRAEGVVVTYTDITDRKRAAAGQAAAMRRAQRANVAATRVMATAQHDLRQPLQALALLQGLLADGAEGERSRNLAARMGRALTAMSGMLDTLLGSGRPDAMPGVARSQATDTPRLRSTPSLTRDGIAGPVARPKLVTGAGTPIIFVVDDDSDTRAGIRNLLEADGRSVQDYPSCEAFLYAYRPGQEACLLIDAYLPGMCGLELLQWLHDSGDRLAAVMITGTSDVTIAVQAMKAGAADFIEKPFGRGELLAAVARALERASDSGKLAAWRQVALDNVSGLTPRQRQVMELVLAGHPSKNIAADLGISQRTVENHRASIMLKTGAGSLPALARLALAAAGRDSGAAAAPHRHARAAAHGTNAFS